MVHPVDAHIGQRVRQRRWMMGMNQRQLGLWAGLELERIQSCEAGTEQLCARGLWDIAAALEVPVSFLFEGLDGQAPYPDAARGEVLIDQKALDAVRGFGGFAAADGASMKLRADRRMPHAGNYSATTVFAEINGIARNAGEHLRAIVRSCGNLGSWIVALLFGAVRIPK